MAERTSRHVWGLRAAYVAVALVVLGLQLVPLGTAPRGFAGPDLVLALTVAWAIRRPAAVPIVLVAAVTLVADMLLQRPPGLWAAIVVGAAAYLVARHDDLAEATFAIEWAAAGLAILCVCLAYLVAFQVLAPYAISARLLTLQMILTIAAYPAVTALSWLALGVGRPRAESVEEARRGRTSP
ncbi:MAG: rod shape-determining protein MreD [Shimia sp.]